MSQPCSSDPTAGCDNSQLIDKISVCCDTTNSNLSSIDTKLSNIYTEQTECCSQIVTKLGNIESLLTQILAKQ